jgi:hypothetical protein
MKSSRRNKVKTSNSSQKKDRFLGLDVPYIVVILSGLLLSLLMYSFFVTHHIIGGIILTLLIVVFLVLKPKDKIGLLIGIILGLSFPLILIGSCSIGAIIGDTTLDGPNGDYTWAAVGGLIGVFFGSWLLLRIIRQMKNQN